MVGTADAHSHRGAPPDFSGRPPLRGVLLAASETGARASLIA